MGSGWPPGRVWRVLVDFDGTVAPDDPTDWLLERFADPAWRVAEAEWQAGRLTSQACMQRQAALMRATPDDLDAAIRAVRIDPAFPAFLGFCRRLSIDVTIVSDGFDRVVRTMLDEAGLRVRFFANALQWQGGDRWHLALPHRRADCRTGAANCKCAHGARGNGLGNEWGDRWVDCCVAIGDGRSDFCMAARAGYVIAKGALADFCRAQGLRHATFTNFDDAAGQLAEWVERSGGDAPTPALRRRPGQHRSSPPSST